MRKRVNGISFDGIHTYYDLGLYLAKRPDLGSPEPKLSLVEIPGADGVLDLTEQNFGEVKYNNRNMIFSMSAMVDADKHQAFKSRIMQALHGKRFEQIILDEDSDWYYSGRVTVVFEEAQPWKIHCMIMVDAAPYALKTSLTEVTHTNFPDGETVVQVVELAENQPINSATSLFMLGTRTYPNGVSGWDRLRIEWPENAKYYNNRIIRIWDNEGGTQDVNITTTPMSSGGYMFLVSDLTSVVPLNVYQIKVSGIGSCRLYGSREQSNRGAIGFDVWNERKTAVPEWYHDGATPIRLTVNGKDIVLASGWSTREDVWLSQGWNKIRVSYGSAELTKPHTMIIRYQEGKL